MKRPLTVCRNTLMFKACRANSVEIKGVVFLKKCVFIGMILLCFLSSSVFGEDDIVLARIGQRTITSGDLQKIIGSYTDEQQQAFEQVPENKVKLLQRLVEELVLSAEARKLGIDRDSVVRERVERLVNSQLATELLKREVTDKIKVTDSDARIYYELNKDDFKAPETVRARHILVNAGKTATEDEKEKAREKAEGLLKRLKDGEAFDKLASEFSDDTASKAKGGDLGFFEKGKMIPAFESALVSLKPGEMSGIIETRFGYHIIKLEERKDAHIRPFEEVKKQITEKLLKDFTNSKTNDYIETLIKTEKVEVYPQRALKGTK